MTVALTNLLLSSYDSSASRPILLETLVSSYDGSTRTAVTNIKISKFSNKRVITPGDFYVYVKTGAIVEDLETVGIDVSRLAAAALQVGVSGAPEKSGAHVVSFGSCGAVTKDNVVIAGDWYSTIAMHEYEVTTGDYYFEIRVPLVVFNDWYFEIKSLPIYSDWYFDVGFSGSIYHDFVFEITDELVVGKAQFTYTSTGGTGTVFNLKASIDIYLNDTVILTSVARLSIKRGSTTKLIFRNIPEVITGGTLGIFVSINYTDVVGEYSPYAAVKEVEFVW